MADPAFGTTVDTEIDLDEVETRFVPGFLLDADSNLEPADQPAILTNIDGFIVPEFSVFAGVPAEDKGIGGRFGSSAGLDAQTVVTAPLDAKTLPVGSYARWMPYAEYLGASASSGRKWYPQGFAQADTSPRLTLYTVLKVGAGGILNGHGTYGIGSPGIEETYSYSSSYGRISKPAMAFESGAAELLVPSSYTSVTFGLVAVFHPSELPYYGIFEALNSAGNKPLALRYAHGRLALYFDEHLVLKHESHAPSHSPAIILLSLNGATDTGKIMVVDKTRTTRTFDIVGLDYLSLRGVFGALGQATTASPWRFPSEMDVLEFDIWDRALDFPEMTSVANLMSLAYGVSQ